MGDVTKRQSILVSFKGNSGGDCQVHTRGHTGVTPPYKSYLLCGSLFWKRFIMVPQVKCVNVGEKQVLWLVCWHNSNRTPTGKHSVKTVMLCTRELQKLSSHWGSKSFWAWISRLTALRIALSLGDELFCKLVIITQLFEQIQYLGVLRKKNFDCLYSQPESAV